MNSLFYFFLLTHPLYAGGFQGGKESEHFLAEFWQRNDGKYCVRIIPKYLLNEKNCEHIHVFENMQHAEECPCDWQNWFDQKKTLRVPYSEK